MVGFIGREARASVLSPNGWCLWSARNDHKILNENEITIIKIVNDMVDGYTEKQDECANKRFYEFLTEERKINELVKKDIEIDRLKAELQKVNDVETSHEKALHKHFVMPRFEFTYTFTDRTDASIHTEIIEAETAEEGLNALHRKHNYRIEWRTTKELNGA
jgi:hypothetical protein